MVERLIATDGDTARFIARAAVALVMFPHGAQKLLGWFGGKGFDGTVEMFSGWGFHPALIVLLILTESIGAVLLLAGFLGRIWAAGMAVIMLVAVGMVHFRFGFFMNWYAEPRGEGFEFHILLFALSLITIIGGSGRWSVDRVLQNLLARGSTRAGVAA